MTRTVNDIQLSNLPGIGKGTPGPYTKGTPGPYTAEPIGSWACKGMPYAPYLASCIGKEVLNSAFLLPVMVIRESALFENLKRMAAWCADAGVLLAPHGKSAMSPRLALTQLELGAWGVTVATLTQARVFRHFAIRRILLANELVDPAGIAWLVDEIRAYPDFEFFCYVDSVAGVQLLQQALNRAAFVGRLSVLVEIGAKGGRTGCRTATEALATLHAISNTDHLTFAGIAAYEGVLAHDSDDASIDLVRTYCGKVKSIGNELLNTGLGRDRDSNWIVTAGGSAYFDVVSEELKGGWSTPSVSVILRSGAYPVHDEGIYKRLSPFGRRIDPGNPLRPALEVFAHVVSVPETGLALLAAGRRDLPYDEGLPIATSYLRQPSGMFVPLEGWSVTDLNDQHTYLRSVGDSPTDLEVGDIVRLGISHPCSAFDRWKLIPLVDDDYRVTDFMETFF